MSEVKFACPHCGQHIACDRGYVDMCIVCPTCGKPMEVPRLSAAEASHPDMYLVASVPQPKQRFTSRIPTIGMWTEEEWEERYRAASTPPQQMPVWLMSAMGTVIAAAILKAILSPNWAIVLCVLAGTGLSCFFVARGQRVPGTSAVYPELGRLVGLVVLVLFAIPVVALGVLFIGCARSCQ